MIVELRKWKLEDASDLAEIISNKKIQDNLRDGIPYPYTKTDAEFFINDMLNADPDKVYAFAITADGKLAGSIAVYRQNNIHYRTGELGYYIGEKFWDRGIGTEAVKVSANLYLKILILSVSLQSHFPIIKLHAEF